eukprot:CAMPEP_0194332854 /NCGR_PEP_ID=MMETSP0171-20130528/60575_1 /TAXON_ID=218684 /ORGANISM="Corethron pennatum, Strain L29A3" /LENGTH=109 /DNA_ID=CAMNT_0039094865 /DNA_START=276 /DNA_END=602 /DNA_ORIENTATION=-
MSSKPPARARSAFQFYQAAELSAVKREQRELSAAARRAHASECALARASGARPPPTPPPPAPPGMGAAMGELSRRWKALDITGRRSYVDRAEADLERYSSECRAADAEA